MKFRTLSALAVLLMTTSLAQAAFNADDVAAQLTGEGYTRVEIKIGQSTAKVEAIKGTTKLEVTYDIASGKVLKTETEAVDSNDNTTPGVVVRTLRGDDGSSDDDSGSDDDSDDRDGSGSGSDHDDDDDHGGDDNSGRGGNDDDGQDDRDDD